MALASCQVGLWGDDHSGDRVEVTVERYDRLQCRYLTTGDFSALQSMNTTYPMETRTLVENVLALGNVDEPDINNRMLRFYQDTTLQAIIAEAATQYASMRDINDEFSRAFQRLRHDLPSLPVPVIYAQIGALTQSVIIGDGTIGICLDKYLGADYPAYRRFYHKSQLPSMTREYIVPDCLTFYLLSLYPLHGFETVSQAARDTHMGRIEWVVNRAVGRRLYDSPSVRKAAHYMHSHPETSVEQLLNN